MAWDAFLKLGDGSKAKGESTDAKHTNEIELTSFAFAISNPSTVGSATTGSGAGKAAFSTFTVSKRTDKASAVLLQMCSSGDHFDKAQITLRKAGGKNPLEYLIYTFEQVYVDGIQWAGQTKEGDVPVETVSFSFSTVHAKYTPQKPDGTGDSPVEGGWDLVQNQPK